MQMLERFRVGRPEPQATLPEADQPLGDGLKSFFDSVTSAPIPDRLLKLADELEAAFERGDLGRCGKGLRRSL